MKIKCIVFAILFCLVSSSALAWSFPWQRRTELPQRVPIPPSETTPTEPTPERITFECRETPEFAIDLYLDLYCCSHNGSGRYVEDIKLCLNNSLQKLQAIESFLSSKIMPTVYDRLPRSIVVPPYDSRDCIPDSEVTVSECTEYIDSQINLIQRRYDLIKGYIIDYIPSP